MMVTAMRFARPLLQGLSGAATVPPLSFRVRSGEGLRKKAGRREWLRARLAPDTDGVPTARKFPRDGAGILSSIVASDGLIELPEDLTEIEPGGMVDFLPFSELQS
jgi:molybdopterin molybdotransferase